MSGGANTASGASFTFSCDSGYSASAVAVCTTGSWNSPTCVPDVLDGDCAVAGALTGAGTCNLKFSDDPSLVNTDGWNYLSASCEIGTFQAGDKLSGGGGSVGKITVGPGKTMKVKKNPLTTGTVVIQVNFGQHFEVKGGRLEMEGLTLTGSTGGLPLQGGAVAVTTSGSALFQECSFEGITGSYVSSHSLDFID